MENVRVMNSIIHREEVREEEGEYEPRGEKDRKRLFGLSIVAVNVVGLS
jgi:hypothetical protein